jgi:uroporphyrinogen III methyltransferase/synthase
VLRALDETSRARILRGEVRLVSISPVTSAKIAELGFPVSAEAKVYTAAGLLDAVIELACSLTVP